jgi:hypothetical protein
LGHPIEQEARASHLTILDRLRHRREPHARQNCADPYSTKPILHQGILGAFVDC